MGWEPPTGHWELFLSIALCSFVFPCILPMCSYAFPCIPKGSRAIPGNMGAANHHLDTGSYSYVFLCIPMFSYVFLCTLCMYSCVFLCIPKGSRAILGNMGSGNHHLGTGSDSYVFLCIPMHSYLFFLCIPM